MPPVADKAATWDEAIAAALKANVGTKNPSSVRQLYLRLGAMAESNAGTETWKKTIRLIRNEDRASEANAKLIAQALGVHRSSLPPSAERLTLATLNRRLEAVEAEALTFERLGPILNVLQLLAIGNTDEALRALSEVAEEHR